MTKHKAKSTSFGNKRIPGLGWVQIVKGHGAKELARQTPGAIYIPGYGMILPHARKKAKR